MHNVYAFLMFFCGAAYFGVIGYLAWFSPAGYKKLLAVWKKWIKATSVVYLENDIEFILSPSGAGLWIIRITVIPPILLCCRGMVFGMWGI